MDILIWGVRSKIKIVLRMLEELYGHHVRATGIFDKTGGVVPGVPAEHFKDLTPSALPAPAAGAG